MLQFALDGKQCHVLVGSVIMKAPCGGTMNSLATEAQSISACGATIQGSPLDPQELRRMQAY
jgi:hypothetical protein